MEDVDAALGSETTACPDVVNAVDAMGRTGNIILPRTPNAIAFIGAHAQC